MASKLFPSPGGRSVLVFGCQSLSFDANNFRQLRATVMESSEHHWMLDILAELPVYWRTAATKYIPNIQSLPGAHQLRELYEWFRSGKVTDDKFPLPYVQLAPLLIMTHLTQYSQYLQLTHPDYATGGMLNVDSSPIIEIIGFCIGFLSAAAVSGAANRDQLREYGAVALRLSLFLGALGDAEERLTVECTSLATMWNSPELVNELTRVVGEFPEAYISVSYDENRATVMAPRSIIPKLQQALQSAGLVANEVDFHGRYHWEGHQNSVQALIQMCDADLTLQLPDASKLVLPTRANTDVNHVRNGPLHHLVLQSVLAQQCQWFQTFSAVHDARLNDDKSIVVSFGQERCVPPSISRSLRGRVIHFADLELAIPSRTSPLRSPAQCYDEDIAVVGMACRVAGADDLEEFWQILCSGKSQHRLFPPERYEDFETPWRPDSSREWYGNFLKDIDAYDHKFFKKSPREAMSMDPQQRLIMQVAYQALEQSGYFYRPNIDKNIGCYIASCAIDYEHNINCHPSSAYGATGCLRAFLAGKLSHHFGWRGPAFCVDSACSGSAVALHQACRSILSGECTAALVGGANSITNVLGFQNLAGASFVSPTGPCKPFDTKADGYCRGEGFAAVFVKKMSAALADGDTIIGTIASTAVEQNNNCTPIVVPDVQSLAGLFSRVTQRAHLIPKDITVVEAHGTGTQAGDPAEYSSVRQALGGRQRSTPLSLGSVKGLVGHTEGVSGVVALVKVLLMINEGMIPPQPNFNSLNPHINASPDDNIEIVKQLKPWKAEYRAVLINNYGASGSNASMVITQSPNCTRSNTVSPIHAQGLSLPFRFCAVDERRLRDYAIKFRQFLHSKAISARYASSLANLAYNVSRQSNPTLDRQLIFSCHSTEELDAKLAAFIGGDESQVLRLKKPVRPVILCFGGQVSTWVGLDRTVYDSIHILRTHLNQCNETLETLGYDSLFPGIFERTPITDQVKLQTKLFSLQYACARSWMDSGISIAAVVGHSFGELTALCISSVLSLSDAMTMVARRATLIRDSWGADSGSMIAVEGELEEIQSLLNELGRVCPDGVKGPTIACFNGPRSFTLAGATAAIDAVQQTFSSHLSFTRLRAKRLTVTNAFHSTLVDPLVPDLHQVMDGLYIREPSIHLEHATEQRFVGKPTSHFVAEHLRQPVYFGHAIKRLAEDYPSAAWLEAGSNSTITVMASRALSSSTSSHYFQSVNITNSSGIQNLAETTTSMWKEGIPVTFWAHHFSQTREYAPTFIPPYQFEKTRHWLESKPLPNSQPDIGQASAQKEEPKGIFSFVGYQDREERVAKFHIHTSNQQYHDTISGHVCANTAALAPSSFMMDIVIEALFTLPSCKNLVPRVYNVASDAPLCLDPTREGWIELHAKDTNKRIWDIKWISENPQKGPRSQMVHCTARITLSESDDAELQNEFARYSRLVNHRQCHELLNDPDVDDILQGRNVYRVFAEIVDYSEPFRGVRKLVGKGTASAGRIVKKYTGETWVDTFLTDSFCQCTGFFVNCMTNRSPSDIYVASGMEQWMRSPVYVDRTHTRPEFWDVFATHQRGENHYTSDLFVFNPTTGELVEAYFGLQYARVPKLTFSKILSKFAPGSAGPLAPASSSTETNEAAVTPQSSPKKASGKNSGKKKAKSDLASRVKAVVVEFSAVDPSEIQDDSTLADSGIDSLMAMELSKEIEIEFKCTLSATALMEAETFRDMVNAVQAALGDADNGDEDDDGSSIESDDNQSDEQINYPTPESATSASSSEMTFHELSLPQKTVLEAFGETKALTDEFLLENKCGGRIHNFTPLLMQLCIVLTLEAFEQLGSNLRAAQAGERLNRIQFDPQHKELVDYLYLKMEEYRILDLDGTTAIRTTISAPTKSSSAILEEICRLYPEYAGSCRLPYFTGTRLASVLRGEQDGLQLIFGTPEGQELVSWTYGNQPHNISGYMQMIDFIKRLVRKLGPSNQGPLKILEMGAGTGGGTNWFLPELAKLDIPVEYIFTDISPAFLAAARRRYKQYSFIKYRTHDIEKPPADDLIGTQHIVIASNAVHATSNLQESNRQIRKALRPDGFLLMLEMTRPIFSVDLVFGLFRGWWVFEDGRTHAITDQWRWEKDLHAAGYGHVDWTDGHSPEISIQRVILAMALGNQGERLSLGPNTFASDPLRLVDNITRKQTTDEYIRCSIQGFKPPTTPSESVSLPRPSELTVLVTGATGSLGSHLVAHLARLPFIKSVVCLNRPNSKESPIERQRQSLEQKGISLSPLETAKLLVLETNTTEPKLGLPQEQYDTLLQAVTHIIHSAWPMSVDRALPGFEPQFRVMRNVLDFARDIACLRPTGSFPVSFQLISSISVVGYQPLLTGKAEVPEERGTINAVMSNGYSEAKFICERILDETLHKYPKKVRAMTVRVGQISGSKTSGYWNPVEHLAALLKSAQTLRALPDFQGVLSWTPVNDVAAALGELLLTDSPYPIYHIDNPVRQSWREMIPVLTDGLGIPLGNVIPFLDWIHRVKSFPGSKEDNPAALIADMLDGNFVRMSCGGLLLETSRSREHSPTLAGVGPVSPDVTRLYLRAWKETGFLH